MSPQRITLPRVNMAKVRPWLPIAGAALGGLILGLIIGWVVWPVNWTNAQLVDLAPEQKAAYLGAVADAYALDGTQSPETNMLERIAAFGDATADEVVAALEYYRGQPDSNPVQLANLGKMATFLGVPVDASMVAAPAEAVEPNPALEEISAQDAGAAPAVEAPILGESASPAPAERSRSAGIVTWLIALLASLALIGGGVYLLLRMSRPRAPSSSMTQPAAPVLPGEPRPVQPVMAASPDKGAQARTKAWTPERTQQPQPGAPVNDLAFDDEEIEDDPSIRYQRTTGTVIPMAADDEPSVSRYMPPSGPSSTDVVEQHAATYASASGRNGGAMAAPVAATAQPSVVTLPQPAGMPVAPSAPEMATMVMPGAAVATTIVAPPVRSEPRPPARKFVAKYVCEYFAGAPDYIEAHSIMDPITSKYIGECGMGVSNRNRSIHANPDQVIALDVWMYDKLDPRDNVQSTRVLLSDYAASHDLAQALVKDRDLSKVVVVKPGTKFQVDGRNLVLEGEIISVEYDSEGVFRGVKTSMTILSRK